MTAQPEQSYALATAHLEKNRYGDALALFEQLAQTAPDNPDYCFQAGNTALFLKDYNKAEGYLRRAIDLAPGEPSYYSRLGVLFMETNKPAKGIRLFKQVITIAPNFTSAYINLAVALYRNGHPIRALNICKKARKKFPEDPSFPAFMASIYREQWKIPLAEAMIQNAIQIAPDHSGFYCDYGTILFESGNRNAAQINFEKAIELDNRNAVAHRMLAYIGAGSQNNHNLQQIENLLSSADLPLKDCADLNFSLAKIHEDQKEYSLSFRHYKTANDILRQMYPYNPQATSRFFDQIRSAYTPEFIKSHEKSGSADETPVFIVGMVGSGTSLAEQILASHKDVHGGGDMTFLQSLQTKIYDIRPAKYAEKVHTLSASDFLYMAESYLAVLRKKVGNHPRITDKMSYNFRYIGLIKILFPRARIVHCVRHPIATCLSAYMHSLPDPYLSYAYDFKNLAQYCLQYQGLMAYWKKLFPDGFYDLSYENLLANQEEETRRLLAYCGLDWDENCLKFYETQRPVCTASALKVKNPIDPQRAKAWKNFEPYIGDLISELSFERPKRS